MKTRRECSFFIDNSNIVVITVVLKTDHTSEKMGTNPSRKQYFLRFEQQITISVLFCQGTQETLIKSLKRFLGLNRFVGSLWRFR